MLVFRIPVTSVFDGAGLMSAYGKVDDQTVYSVIVNSLGQYSLWPVQEGRPLPGWKEIGKTGKRQECLDYICGLMSTEQYKPFSRSVDDEGCAGMSTGQNLRGLC